MSKEDAQEDGRMIVVSAKVPAALVARIDAKARRELQMRAQWLKAAILEKLARDAAPVLS